MIASISASELKQWMQQQLPFELLDVREPYEREADHIGGRFIPMEEVLKRAGELPTQVPLVIYCHRGIRSAIIIQRLLQKVGFTNLYNLHGGIAAWRKMESSAQ